MNTTKLHRSIMVLGLAAMALRGINAQEDPVFSTRNATASFYSSAPLEDIRATTGRARAAMNTKTGELLFVVPVTGFVFEKSLMQQHFNDQYMESERFPEARFEGSIADWKDIPRKETEVSVRGKLTIHGVTRQVTEKATLKPSGKGILGTSTFLVRLEDYDIRIPRIVIMNIAETVEVNVSAEFKSR